MKNDSDKDNHEREIVFIARRYFHIPKLVKVGRNAICVVIEDTAHARESKRWTVTNTAVTCAIIFRKSDWH